MTKRRLIIGATARNITRRLYGHACRPYGHVRVNYTQLLNALISHLVSH